MVYILESDYEFENVYNFFLKKVWWRLWANIHGHYEKSSSYVAYRRSVCPLQVKKTE
jgi:hypothetical protein